LTFVHTVELAAQPLAASSAPEFGGNGEVEMREAMIIEEHRVVIPKKRLIVGMKPSWREYLRRSSWISDRPRSLIRSLAEVRR